MILKIISQSGVEGERIISEYVADLFRIGDRQFVTNSIMWIDNKTFFIGDKGNTTFNNQLQAFQYDHNNSSFYYTDVGVGTVSSDTYNHPAGYIWIDNNYIYVGQSNTHNDLIDIFKSNATNSITSGFTKLTSISGDNAYPHIFKNINGKTCFSIRWNDDELASLEFDIGIQISSSDIEGSFALTLITKDSAATWRHYNSAPVLYGTQTHNVLVISHRNDSLLEYFAHYILTTTDFVTFSNYDNTFSKDVTSAVITDAELETNYLINGTQLSPTIDLNYMNSIMVDDVFYGIAIKESTSDYYVFKIDSGVLTTTLLGITNVDTAIFFTPFMYYNGVNIVYSAICNDAGTYTKEIWASTLGLTDFTQKYVKPTPNFKDGAPILLPDNLDQVTGEYAMYIDADTSGDNAYMYVTSDKYYI